MRPSNKSRSRNKTGNNGGHNNNQRRNSMGNIINRVFESAGPDGKVRGTPQQIIDKYQALARDAQVAGDRVAAESYLQHSEHYSRLLGEAQRVQQEARASQERDGDRDDGGFEPRRQPQPHMASGLTMIDTDDGFDSGPIETPEGRRSGFDDNGFGRRDREPRMNGNPHASRPAAPQPLPEAAAPAPQAVAEPAPAPQPAIPEAAEPAAEPLAEAAPVPAAAEKPRRRSAPRETSPEPQAAEPGEIELAEPQAEPVKKPRTRRRKTQPAAEEAAPQPEPAVSNE